MDNLAMFLFGIFIFGIPMGALNYLIWKDKNEQTAMFWAVGVVIAHFIAGLLLTIPVTCVSAILAANTLNKTKEDK
jgi:thiol:disulfide interchange protein